MRSGLAAFPLTRQEPRKFILLQPSVVTQKNDLEGAFKNIIPSLSGCWEQTQEDQKDPISCLRTAGCWGFAGACYRPLPSLQGAGRPPQRLGCVALGNEPFHLFMCLFLSGLLHLLKRLMWQGLEEPDVPQCPRIVCHIWNAGFRVVLLFTVAFLYQSHL